MATMPLLDFYNTPRLQHSYEGVNAARPGSKLIRYVPAPNIHNLCPKQRPQVPHGCLVGLCREELLVRWPRVGRVVRGGIARLGHIGYLDHNEFPLKNEEGGMEVKQKW